MEALRICLACAKALDIETRPVWLMIIGPGSVGKSAFYLQAASAYDPRVFSDEITIPGILSASNHGFGEGVLKKLGKRGLWLISDFTVMLNSSEDKRNALLGAWRKIYDGHYERNADGRKASWHGHIHVILACTNAIERFYRVHSDLGERFLQVRIEKQEFHPDLVKKVANQAEHWEEFQNEIVAAAKRYLANTPDDAKVPFEFECQIMHWADFVSMGRTGTTRNYKDEIVGVSAEEGTARAGQQLLGLVRADAMLQGQLEVGELQMPLVRRVAMDCLPWARRAILSIMPADEKLSLPDLQEISGIAHPYTFDRTIDELVAIGALKVEKSSLGPGKAWLSDRLNPLLRY